MQINVNTWHCRYLRWVKCGVLDLRSWEPRSLCSYFWQCVLLIVVVPLSLLGISPILIPLGLAVFIVYALYTGVNILLDQLFPGKILPEYEGSMRQVVVESVLGWKRRVCPLIEYVRDEE